MTDLIEDCAGFVSYIELMKVVGERVEQTRVVRTRDRRKYGFRRKKEGKDRMIA
jgi:hypothetical protein